MESTDRIALIHKQRKSLLEGKIEDIESFGLAIVDESTDDFISIHEYIGEQVTVLVNNEWHSGELLEDLVVRYKSGKITLTANMTVRVRKALPYSLTELLLQLPSDIFLQFITSLNNLGFSLYDCIYSHNFLSYLPKARHKQGVNFMTFDNEEEICVVQHHFSYYMKKRDRFEFTNSTGRRLVIEKIT